MDFTAKLLLITRTMNNEENVEKVLKNAKNNYVFSEKDFRSLNSQYIVQLLSNKTITKIQISDKQSGLVELQKVSTFQNFWHPNEFKIFVWISVCHAYISNREIQQFTYDDLAFLRSLLPNKTMIFIEYNLRCLQKQDRSTKLGWYQQQQDLLCEIIKNYDLKGKWTDISFLLFEKSEKNYFRSSHKCREKWYNHLDPSVLHTKWTSHEDYKLFQLISEMGTRWACISKSMGGARTQHMVKNRYNSLSKKYAARYQRYKTKKMLDIILKELKKKMENEAQNIVKQQVNEDSQKKSNKCLQTQYIKPISEQIVGKIKSSSIKLQDFLNKTSLLPEWESFQFEQIANSSSIHDMDPFQSAYFKDQIELIDYCSIELQQYRFSFIQ